MKHLVVDTPNLLFRTFSAHTKFNQNPDPAQQAGLAMHVALNTLKSHFNKIKPDTVALVFEGRKNWRKEYTNSDRCVSKRGYKANRVRDDSMIPFYELVDNFKSLIQTHTGIQCLYHESCEGDDMFAAYVEHHCGRGETVMGLSGDKDYVQLIDIEGFTLLNPDKLGADRHKDKKGNPIDPKFFMFEKAFRGDSGDNVMSAFPRVRTTKLEKAFTDEFEFANLMNATWEYAEPSTGEVRTMLVRDLYEENQLLMNLRKQPPEIREIMFNEVSTAHERVGKFSLFHFLKFCGDYELSKIAEDATSFAVLFSNKGYNSQFKDVAITESEKQEEPQPSASDSITAKLRAKANAKKQMLVF